MGDGNSSWADSNSNQGGSVRTADYTKEAYIIAWSRFRPLLIAGFILGIVVVGNLLSRPNLADAVDGGMNSVGNQLCDSAGCAQINPFSMQANGGYMQFDFTVQRSERLARYSVEIARRPLSTGRRSPQPSRNQGVAGALLTINPE